MSMTYKDLQDAVLADAFAEAKRASVKLWLQFRLAWLWDLDEWTFRYASSNVTVTAGSQAVTGVPADFGIALALFNDLGEPLNAYDDPAAFQEVYNANITASGVPEAFTVRGTSILVGPKAGSTSSSYILEYEKKKPVLTNDSDLTGLPDGYDLALVHGAKAEGFKLSTVPGLAADFDADFQAAIEALRRGYLTAVRSRGNQWPAYWQQQGYSRF